MSRRLLTRGWVLVGCACFATVTGAASCSTAANGGSSVTGDTLSIYLSVPPGRLTPEETDVLLAEQLAFRQSARRVGKFTLQLQRAKGAKFSDTAREAIADQSTIAYLGEI